MKIIEGVAASERAVFGPLFKGLGTSSDCSKRIVYFMYDPGGKASDRCQLFCPADSVNCLNAHRYILADSDNVCDLAGFGITHRDLADHPVLCRAVLGSRLLLYPLDLAGAENVFEFLTNLALRIAGKNAEYVAADRFIRGMPEGRPRVGGSR